MNSVPWVSAAHRPMARSWAGARSGSSGGAPAIEGVAEVDHRDLRRDLRNRDAEQVDRPLGLGPDGRGHPGQRVPQHGQHVPVVADKAELSVERHVFGQMPGRVVRLGPEHRTGLVDALENADHGLLVELR